METPLLRRCGRLALIRLGIVLGLTVGLAVPSGAQVVDDADPGPAPPDGAFPVVPTNVPRPSVRAVRAASPITIDGRIDEPAWEAADPMTRFIQSEPNIGYPATERTDVRILYDEDALYLACLCYDSQPDNLTLSSLQRDFSFSDNDVVSFVISPNPEQRNGFLFSINVGGAVWDAQSFDDLTSSNASWDSEIDVRTRRTDFGWTFEAAIPWTTLRFTPTEGPQDWGFNVLRRVRRINETAYWSPLERREPLGRVSRAGTLTGLTGLRQGRNLLLKPYAVGAVASDGGGVAQNDDFDAGADLKYGITPRLTADLTYRTDFSQVEADAVQINLTRFPLFFPERREFFIENSGTFDFGDGMRRDVRMSVSNRDFMLFHSRRIGLTGSGQPVPILGGARLSGGIGDFEVGVLSMRTRESSIRSAETASVARVRWRPSRASTLGFLVTNRDVGGALGMGSARDNTAFGIDATAVLASNRLFLTSYAAGVGGTGLSGDLSDRSALRASVGWRDTFWDAAILARRFGDDFQPDLGFVRRLGVWHQYASLGVHPTVRSFGLQEINPYVELDRYTTLAGVLETRRVAGGVGFDGADGYRASVSFENVFERLLNPFTVGGATIAAGEYESNEAVASYSTSSAREVSFDLGLSYGGYFGGTRTSYSGGIAWRPNQYASLDLALERNDIALSATDVVTNLARVRISASPTTRLSASAFVQYNDLADEVITSIRGRFIHAPLSDLYLVVEERRSTRDAFQPVQSLGVKVTRQLAF